MTVTMSQGKKEKLRSLCLEALDTVPLRIRFVAKVIGKIVSSLPGVDLGKLHYRSLERDKIKALSLNSGDFEGLMSLSSSAKQDLCWWIENVMHATRTICHAPIFLIFQTDASNTGWGITCTTDPSLQSCGIWSQDQESWHINVSCMLYLLA